MTTATRVPIYMSYSEGMALARRIEAEGYKTRCLVLVPGSKPLRFWLSVAGRVKLYRPEDWNDGARRRARRR